MKITCLDPLTPGIRTSVKNLGKDLGAHIHVNTVGELRPDGRRKADQAAHTANKGVASKHVQRVRKDHALTTLRFERSMSRATDPNNPEWVRKRAAQHATRIEQQQAHDLERAVSRIKVAAVDCTINADTVPWLLAYSQMLDEDEGTDMEFESATNEEAHA